MKTAREVILSPSAMQDLDDICGYVEAEAAGRGIEVAERLEEAMRGLARFPQRGRLVPELLALDVRTYRELIVERWRIIYRPSARRVMVLAVFDVCRDVETALLSRLLRR